MRSEVALSRLISQLAMFRSLDAIAINECVLVNRRSSLGSTYRTAITTTGPVPTCSSDLAKHTQQLYSYYFQISDRIFNDDLKGSIHN